MIAQGQERWRKGLEEERKQLEAEQLEAEQLEAEQLEAEQVLGRVEFDPKTGKWIRFLAGEARLAEQEVRVLELSWRCIDEKGRVNFVEMIKLLEGRGGREVSRQTALQTLIRARRKLKDWKDR